MTDHNSGLAAWWDKEADRHNDMGRMAHAGGHQIPFEPLPEPGVEEAVSHLKQLPPHLAVEKAREWTGNNDIDTLPQAIAAVRAMLDDAPPG